MTRKTLACILVILVLGWLALEVHKTFSPTNKENSRVYSIEGNYNVDEELKKAKENYEKTKPIIVIDERTQSRDGFVLCFDGLASKRVMAKIVKSLKDNKEEALFFVQGAFVADSKETVEMILAEGFELGDYSLSGRGEMEKLSKDEILGDFVRSQKVFTSSLKETPSLLKCYETKYSQEVLKAAGAVGFSGVVKNSFDVDLTKLMNLQEAIEYTGKIPKGAIVSFPLKHFSKTDEEKNLEICVENFFEALRKNDFKLNKIKR